MKSIENTGISQYDDWYRSAETDTSGTGSPSPRGAEIDASRGSQIAPLEVPKSTLLEVPESTPLKNYINNNYTNRIYTESNHISSEEAEDEMRGDEKTESVKEMIEENIACEELIRSNPLDGELVNSILEIIVEVLMIRSESMLIASANYPTELVQERFRRINTEHVQYVIDCFKANTTRIGNIKKYLMTALFNAPATMDSYYTAAVHHDMPYLAAQRIGDQSCS